MENAEKALVGKCCVLVRQGCSLHHFPAQETLHVRTQQKRAFRLDSEQARALACWAFLLVRYLSRSCAATQENAISASLCTPWRERFVASPRSWRESVGKA